MWELVEGGAAAGGRLLILALSNHQFAGRKRRWRWRAWAFPTPEHVCIATMLQDARGGLVVQHYWTAKNVAAEHFEQELDKDPLVRQQLLAQVSEEKGTLIKMGPEDTKRVFGLA